MSITFSLDLLWICPGFGNTDDSTYWNVWYKALHLLIGSFAYRIPILVRQLAPSSRPDVLVWFCVTWFSKSIVVAHVPAPAGNRSYKPPHKPKLFDAHALTSHASAQMKTLYNILQEISRAAKHQKHARKIWADSQADRHIGQPYGTMGGWTGGKAG